MGMTSRSRDVLVAPGIKTGTTAQLVDGHQRDSGVLPRKHPRAAHPPTYPRGLSGQEYIWSGQSDRTFTRDTGPTVNGTYRASTRSDLILLHQPGPAPDYIWGGLRPGQDTPIRSTKVEINGTYEPLAALGGWWILYGPGAAPDFMILDFGENPLTIPGTINGDYTTAIKSTRTVDFLIWHRPGTPTDYLWY